jgi:hypothetical protein
VREAIEELLADYAEAIDDGALERWPGFSQRTASIRSSRVRAMTPACRSAFCIAAAVA